MTEWIGGNATPRVHDPAVLDLTAWEQGSPETERSLLQQVAVTLGSTLDLREVLRRLVHMGRGVSEARHCSLFLVDGRTLVPTVSVGEKPEEATWAAFRAMGPIHLDARRLTALEAGRPIVLEDASQSDLIPRRWNEGFSLGAAVLIPLLAERLPCGLMALDWAEPREFSDDEVSVLAALGTYAGIAVGNARLFEVTRRRSRLQETLVRGAGALAEPLRPEEIADRLAAAYDELLGAGLCAIALFDVSRSRITTIASRGTRPLKGQIPMEDVPEAIVSRVWRHWERVKEPIELEPHPWLESIVGGREMGVEWYLLIPLVVEGHSRGCALIGLERRRRLGTEDRVAAEALASMAASALERCVLVASLERKVSQLDAVYRASASISEGGDADTLIAQVNDLLVGHGFEVTGLAFSDERLRTRLRAEGMTGEEMAGWTRGDATVSLRDGSLSLPVRLNRRLVGALRVRGESFEPEEVAFLEALGRGLAKAAERDALRAELEDAAVDRAVAEDRQRMAVDLHASVGSALYNIGLTARDLQRKVPEPTAHVVTRIADLAEEGKREIDEAARALIFFPSARRGLVPSLRALAAEVEADSGITVEVETAGEVARLDSAVEGALIRVAHEAFSNAWRHGQCSAISAVLVFEPEQVQLQVHDDGAGCGLTSAIESVGLAGVRKIVEGVDGSAVFGDDPNGGFRVLATVPRRVKGR